MTAPRSPIQLSPCVHAEFDGDVLVLVTDNPPVNVLSAEVRQGLAAGLDLLAARDDLTAAVLLCAGRGFFAGSDMREFGGPIARPDLPDLIAALRGSAKPVVAALHGTALGGGFELALAAQTRVALPEARMGLPEVTLGLVPACGGIEAVTRRAGVEAALDLAVLGRTITGAEAAKLGLVDALATADLRQAAVGLARSPLPRPGPRPDADAASRIAAFRAGPQGRRLAGQDAPAEILRLIEAAATDPQRDLSAETREAFFRLERDEQSRALRHLFAAERRVGELPFLPAGVAPLPVTQTGVVGAGTMGSGIATVLVTVGLPVTLIDANADNLDRGRAAVAANLSGAVRRGKLTETDRAAALDRLTCSTDLATLAAAELVIEAVYEQIDVKIAVFRQLDALCKPGAILASNTSFLDIDRIAAATRRPDLVVGLHFFSPAHVMRLLEVVRGAATNPAVVRTAMELGRRLGKIAVCVGNCHGFVGNRILLARQTAAMQLLLSGVSPYDIDAAMTGFGLPMGPFHLADLAGLDVGWDRETSAGRSIEEVFCEAGRLGCKTGKGYYDYDARGRPSPSQAALALIDAFRAGLTKPSPPAAPEAILDRLLEPMLREVDALVAESIALRPSDIDVIWVHGYGWPRWRGGPAWFRGYRD